MAETVLTELQSACRAAHEQVQLLRDLYTQVSGKAGEPFPVDIGRRIRELDEYETVLARKLEELHLLPKQPDPEREGLLELIAEVKAAFSADDRPAISERLAAEERELRNLTGRMLEDHDEASLRDARAASDRALSKLPRA